MKRIISCIGWILLLAFLLNATPVFAAETTPEDVLLEVTSGKEAYEDGEAVSISLTVENNLPFAITNVYVQLTPPDGFSIENEEKLPAGEMIRSGKKLSAKVTLAQQVPPEDATGLPAQQSPQEEEEAQDYSLWIIIGAIIVGLAIVTVVVILIIKKKRGAKTVISMLLVCALLGSMIVLPAQAATANIGRESLTEAVTFSVDGETHTLTATVYFDQNEHADDLQIDTSRLGYQEDLEAFVITDEFDGLYGTLKNEKKYSEIKLEVYTERGTLLQKQSIPATAAWHFEEVGLIPGVNRVKITAIGEAILAVQLNLYDPFGANYSYLDGHDTDSDEEGLFDLLEKELGTDPLNPDTDGDGLTDYEEVYKLGTDPLKADSDENGIPDGDEDYDGDQISDKEELALGLSPILDDTDGDKVSDYDELNLYGTDPFTKDSDGDGAEDGWELEHGYQPGSTNETFTVSGETNPVSAANPVSLEVSVTGSGTAMDVESLGISPVSVGEDPFASPCIAGYLGPVMDITIDGSFETATLTFRYDTSLGRLGDDFQPRIYCFNEATETFEELENQTVRNGVITAQTSHFSKYTVLNSIAYMASFVIDEIEETVSDGIENVTTKKSVLESYATADIAFVMDNSASMAWNDPNGKCQEVALYFINRLRSGFDRGAVFSYTKALKPLQRLTKDQVLLRKAVDSIRADNGVNSASGTDGFAALRSALEGLKGSSGSYRYVIFFSDGDDTTLKNNLTQIQATAIDSDVKIICIGIGTGEESYLAELAEATGGQYYPIKTTTSVPATFGDTIEILDAITPTTKDSNNDGLDDYVTKLILDGKIVLSNGSRELWGVDFSLDFLDKPSADWDNDGLKNGEELQIRVKDGKAYLVLASHPCRMDTDGDGYSDLNERKANTNPKKFSIQREALDEILNVPYYHKKIAETYDPDAYDEGYTWIAKVENGLLNIDAFIFAGGHAKRKELYWELMIEYYTTYGEQILSDNTEAQMTFMHLAETLHSLQAGYYDAKLEVLSEATDLEGYWSDSKTIFAFIRKIEDKTLSKEALSDKQTTAFLDEILKQAGKLKLKLPVKWQGIERIQKLFDNMGDYLKEAEKLADDLGKVGDVLTYVEAAADVIDTIGNMQKVSVHCDVFQANMDVLEYIMYNSHDSFARSAAGALVKQLTEEFFTAYNPLFTSIVDNALSIGLDAVKTAIGTAFPPAGVFFIVVDAVFGIVNWISGIEGEVHSTYKLICFNEMADAYTHFIGEQIEAGFDSNYYISAQSRPSLTHNVQNLAKIRELGEKQYLEHYDITNWIWANRKKYENLKTTINNHIDRNNTAATALADYKVFYYNVSAG